MTSSGSLAWTFLASCLLGLTACTVEPSPSEGSPDLSMAIAAFGPDSVGPGERADAALAKSVPGYGGVWFDAKVNKFVVAVAPGADHTAVANAARLALADRVPEADNFEIETRPVDYSFAQLAIWRNQIRQFVFDDPGTVALDLDEQTNRVRILTSTDATSSSLAAGAAAKGIPAEALVFERSGPVRSQVLLTDHRRPVEDGFQIVFNTTGGQYVCTVGANVWAPGGPIKGFLTASHCSKDLGTGNGVNGIDYYQNTSAFWNHLGKEAIDPMLS